MTEYPRTELSALRTLLANLYPTVEDARVLVTDAGLEAARIEFSSKAITNWFNILQYANPRNAIDDIISTALKDNPNNELLERALKREPPAIAEGPEANNWSGPAGTSQLEKIMGKTSTLVPIAYLEIGLMRSRSIARVRRSDGSLGTGFLTENNILVTNNHVLPNADVARGATAQFNYQETPAGANAPMEELRLAPDSFLRTSVADDWTAVRVEGNPAETWGTIEMRETAIKAGDHVNIIQHPGGGPKQISLFANVVAFVGDGRVQYLTDTLPGSSGSPVFDARWSIVALHHSGGWLTEPNAASKRTYYRNEGISIDRIIKGLSD
ncbi:MAG TPA: trypsin-like peptidase domain-containing protein [Candidatus Limnocylindrales bacterium]|nr:trypsin-like peptidase domain-containing protein [Candidatus Limnocylindrales bacterium]